MASLENRIVSDMFQSTAGTAAARVTGYRRPMGNFTASASCPWLKTATTHSGGIKKVGQYRRW